MNVNIIGIFITVCFALINGSPSREDSVDSDIRNGVLPQATNDGQALMSAHELTLLIESLMDTQNERLMRSFEALRHDLLDAFYQYHPDLEVTRREQMACSCEHDSRRSDEDDSIETVTPDTVSAIIVVDMHNPHVQVIKVSRNEPNISMIETDWPEPRMDPGVLVIENKIWIISGWHDERVDIFDPVQNTWRRDQDLVRYRSLPSVALLNGTDEQPKNRTLWACGCWGGSGKSGTECEHECERRDLDNPASKWEIFRIPEYICMEAHAGVQHQGRMYVSGGRCDFIIHKSVYMYDEASPDQWQRLADMMVPRHLHEMATDGEQIYACGGHPGLKSCERYDQSVNIWHQIAPMPTPGRYSLQLVFDDDAHRMYAIGGTDGERPMYNIDMYDRDLDEWTPSGVTLATATRDHVAVIVPASHFDKVEDRLVSLDAYKRDRDSRDRSD